MRTQPRHIEGSERKYDKAFARDPLFKAYLIDRIHKCVQVLLHSCNTTAIEDVGSGSLAKFEGLQKKVERGEWLTLTPVWVDRPLQKEEGRRKLDRHGTGTKPSGGGGGRNAIFNHGIDLQLRIMERLGNMTGAACLENLRIPLAADVREICLHFLSKGDCVISCTRSHVPVQGHNRDLVMGYIRVARKAMDPYRKRRFDGGRDQGSRL